MTNYSHTQRGLIHWACFAAALLMGCGILVMPPEPFLTGILLVSAMICVLLGFSARSLTVTDCGNELLIAFGPVPLLRKRIAYSEVACVRIGQTKLIDGWGVHFLPGRGWTYNIHGWDCVELQLRNRNTCIRVGSDDAGDLANMIREKIDH